MKTPGIPRTDETAFQGSGPLSFSPDPKNRHIPDPSGPLVDPEVSVVAATRLPPICRGPDTLFRRSGFPLGMKHGDIIDIHQLYIARSRQHEVSTPCQIRNQRDVPNHLFDPAKDFFCLLPYRFRPSFHGISFWTGFNFFRAAHATEKGPKRLPVQRRPGIKNLALNILLKPTKERLIFTMNSIIHQKFIGFGHILRRQILLNLFYESQLIFCICQSGKIAFEKSSTSLTGSLWETTLHHLSQSLLFPFQHLPGATPP